MSSAADGSDPAHSARLLRALGDAPFGRPLYAFQRVGSTMTIARRLAAEGAPEGTLVWAARQTHGRGRLGRTWASPTGGLYCSLILRPPRPPTEIPQLSLVSGLAVAETIREASGLLPAIRWPNDILLGPHKVCGILVEGAGPSVIVGIGINVAADPRQLPEGATSLAGAGAAERDPCRLTSTLCRRLAAWYTTWLRDGFPPIRAALRPWMAGFGRVVHIRAGRQRFEGIAADLDERGRLLVRLDSGILQAFEMGEVTLLR